MRNEDKLPANNVPFEKGIARANCPDGFDGYRKKFPKLCFEG